MKQQPKLIASDRYEWRASLHLHPCLRVCLLAVLHMLIIAMPPFEEMPWAHQPLMKDVYAIILPPTILPRSDGDGLGISVLPADQLFAAVIALCCFGVAMFVWHALCHAGYFSYRPSWRIKLLRLTAHLYLHGFVVPMTAVLLSPLKCTAGDSWLNAGDAVVCFGGAHIGMLISGLIVLAIMLGYLVLIASTFIDRTPDASGKKNMLCKSHGRIDAAMVILRAIAGALWVFTDDGSALAAGIIALCISLAWFYAFFTFLPHHHLWLNKLQLAMASTMIAAAACTLLAIGLNESKWSTAAIAWLCLLPTASYAGWMSADLRFRQFSSDMELTSVYAVELRARYLLSSVSSERPIQTGRLGRGITSGDHHRSHASSKHRRDHTDYNDAGLAGGRDDDAMSYRSTNSSGGRSGRSSNRNKGLVDSTTTPGTRLGADVKQVDEESGVGMSGPVFAIDQLYREASDVFSGSPMISMFYAHFLGTVRDNRHLERVHIRMAEAKADASAIDIHFMAFQRSKDLDAAELKRNSGSTITGKMTVERRMRFEQLLSRSRVEVIAARQLVFNFWSNLSEKSPDLAKLSVVGVQINKALASTNDIFKELLELAPQSASVMRQYAEYLLELANDPRKAQELLSDAEQIEEEQSKSHQSADTDIIFGAPVADFDLSGESAALMRVSASLDDVGTITAANAAALRMFGYQSRDLIGRDMKMLIPEPIAAVHSKFLDTYMEDGKERVSNSSRVFFGLHKGGYILPIKQNIRPTGDDWAVVSEEIVSPFSFIWFVGEAAGWRITAVCKSAMASLGIDLQSMRQGALSMSHYLSDIPGTIVQMQDEDGSVITLRNTAVDGPSGRTMAVQAKLQICAIPWVPTPVYIIRWRRATALNQKMALGDRGTAAAASVGGASPSVKAISSNEDADADDDDDEADGGRSSVAADSEAFSDGEHSAALAPPPPPARRVLASNGKPASAIKSSGTATTTTTSTRRVAHTPPPGHSTSMPADGDISLCPVMRVSASSSSSRSGGDGTSAAAGAIVNGGGARRVLFDEPPQSPAPVPNAVAPADDGNAADGNATAAPAAETPGQAATDDVATASPTEPIEAVPGPATPLLEDLTAATSRNDAPASDQIVVASTSTPKVAPLTMLTTTTRQGSTRRVSPAQGGVATTSAAASRTKPGITVAPASNIKPSIITTTLPDDQSAVSPVPSHASGHPHRRTHSRTTPSGKAGSVHSKGSSRHSGSKTSATSVTEVLRRGVMARGSRLEASLRSLKQSIFIVFFCIAAMNIISLILTTTLFDQLQQNALLVSKNGDRGIRGQRIVSTVQDVMWWPAQIDLPQGINDTMAKWDKYNNDLEDLHKYLYLHIDGQLQSEVDLYEKPNIVLQDLTNGTYMNRDVYNYTTRTVGLANGGIELLAKSRQLREQPPDQVFMYQPLTFWMMQNARSPMRNAFNASMLLASDRSKTQADSIDFADLIILCLAESLFLAVSALVMVPVVFTVMNSKQSIFDTFLEVPVPIVRALKARVYKRILAIERAEDENEAGIDIAGAGVVDMEDAHTKIRFNAEDHDELGELHGDKETIDSGLTAAINADQNRRVRAVAIDDDDEGEEGYQGWCSCWLNFLHKRGMIASATTAASRKKRHYRKAKSSQFTMVLSMLWPLACYMVSLPFIALVPSIPTYNRSLLHLSEPSRAYISGIPYPATATHRDRFRCRSTLSPCTSGRRTWWQPPATPSSRCSSRSRLSSSSATSTSTSGERCATCVRGHVHGRVPHPLPVVTRACLAPCPDPHASRLLRHRRIAMNYCEPMVMASALDNVDKQSVIMEVYQVRFHDVYGVHSSCCNKLV